HAAAVAPRAVPGGHAPGRDRDADGAGGTGRAVAVAGALGDRLRLPPRDHGPELRPDRRPVPALVPPRGHRPPHGAPAGLRALAALARVRTPEPGDLARTAGVRAAELLRLAAQ